MLFLVLASAPGRADVWDPGDDDSNTTNILVHGTQQVHNLVAPNASTADEDWFAVHIAPRTSWEFLMEGTGPGIDVTGDPFSLVDSAGTVIAGSSFPKFLPGRELNYESSTTSLSAWIRATATGCTTSCGTETVYQVRAYETTLAVPRFNNSGTQTTFLILQNRSEDHDLTGHVWFYNSSGALIANYPFSLSLRGSLVLNTSAVPGAAGQGGHAAHRPQRVLRPARRQGGGTGAGHGIHLRHAGAVPRPLTPEGPFSQGS